MIVVFSPRYRVDIGPHVYVTAKYDLVRDQLVDQQIVRANDLVAPEEASWEELALAHTSDYLHKIRCGELSDEEIAVLEIPWSQEILDGFRLMVGGTRTAARRAIQDGCGINLGGGFHHGFANHGEGFCLFNDIAVTLRVLQRDHVVHRAAVIDCDVHHGNGTAMIFADDARVFTFSIHQQHNYPLFKPASSLDVGLSDGAGDREYLSHLEAALPQVFGSNPNVVFYLAGADPYEDDQLGGLGLTKEGLRRRDHLVLDACRTAGVPVVVTLAGGYAHRLEDTVAIHVATIEEARRVES